MRRLNAILVALVLLLGSAVPAYAIPFPDTPTYSASISGYAPYATAQDVFDIVGSSSKTIRVVRVSVSGTSTSGATIDVFLLKRNVANTGGTPSAATIVKSDTNSGAATAVVNSYAAAPTSSGSLGNMRVSKLPLPAAGGGGAVVWEFLTRQDQAAVQRGTAENLAVNLNGQAIPAGTSLDIDIEWTEDNQ